MPSAPALQTLLLADNVFQQIDGKGCLVGVFSRILAPRLPAVHPSMGIFVVVNMRKASTTSGWISVTAPTTSWQRKPASD
jgi:hypothetical protein